MAQYMKLRPRRMVLKHGRKEPAGNRSHQSHPPRVELRRPGISISVNTPSDDDALGPEARLSETLLWGEKSWGLGEDVSINVPC